MSSYNNYTSPYIIDYIIITSNRIIDVLKYLNNNNLCTFCMKYLFLDRSIEPNIYSSEIFRKMTYNIEIKIVLECGIFNSLCNGPCYSFI